MARVWIVNPFDPLPGDPEQPGRYVSLARLLRDEGHTVTWWTATFSHRFKKPIDQAAIQSACDHEKINIRFIETPSYERNVSLQRFRSHRVYAAGFLAQARSARKPEVIIASNPPLESAAAAAKVARATGSRLIVDVQDIWIETSRRFLPGVVRWIWPAVFRPWIQANRTAYSAADAVVGVAGEYADEPRKYGRTEYRREVVPLGIDLASFDAAVACGNSLLHRRNPGEILAIYSGSLSRNYDVLTVARAAARICRERSDVRFIFSGRGEMESEVRRIVDGCEQVSFLGFAPFEDWAATVMQCDIGWNAVLPEAMIFFPNKIFYYWAAGMAVINSIAGECADWIARTETGVFYEAGNVDSACSALDTLVNDREQLQVRRLAARRTARELWDRRKLYKPYLELVNELSRKSFAGTDKGNVTVVRTDQRG